MNNLTLLPFQKEHYPTGILPNDLKETFSTFAQGQPSWSLFFGGNVLACGGLLALEDGSKEAWVAWSELGKKFKFTVHRFFRDFVANFRISPIVAHFRKEDLGTVEWAKSLGFRFKGITKHPLMGEQPLWRYELCHKWPQHSR
jgi:hypothetical protein